MLLYSHRDFSVSCFAFVVLFMLIDLNKSEPFEYEDSGWRPLSKEDAFRGLRVDMDVQDPDPWTLAESADDRLELLSLKNNVVKVIEPVKLFSGFNVKRDSVNTKKPNEETYNDTPSTPAKYVRIAKKISAATFENQIKEEISANKLKDKLVSETKIETSYEVTEDSTNTEDFINTEQTNLKDKIKSGYVYDPPVIDKLFTENKFTDKLTDALLKYKINDATNLNYIKSRELRKGNLMKPQVIFLPIPVRNYRSFNTDHHLPVNPVLAVLLSNHGFYIPGLYGLQNSYRNLYGYLASNNIHNNRPFGMYKVYSDTDSKYFP